MSSIGILAITVISVGWVVACGDGAPPPLGDHDGGNVIPTADVVTGPPCSTPAATCPCDDAGSQYYCGIIYRISGTHVDCSKGYLTCQGDGTWSGCEGPAIFQGD